MSLRPTSPSYKTLPLQMVGSSIFGRYPKISVEQTWNMIISDNWMVPYAGYNLVSSISPGGQGRGIYASSRFGSMFVAVDNYIYIINRDFSASRIGQLSTFDGNVYFAENNASQIAICDGDHVYIFNYSLNTFTLVTTNFVPGYIAFQDGYFIASAPQSTGNYAWRLSALNNGTSWPDDANHDGELQTKPTFCQAVIPVPSENGIVMVFGKTVVELWQDTGSQLFPYQRVSAYDIDYGCLSVATIAAMENMVVWLAANENAGPFIMFSQGGGAPQHISTDGIDYKLANLVNPQNSYGFLFRQDGHMIYQITFADPADDFSLAYDFNTQKFFNVSANDMGMHIAKRVVFFNNTYYFVSFVDGNVYEFNSNFTTLNGSQVPRVRICPTIRLPDTNPFIVQNLNFPIEQGVATDIERVDLSISIDGGYQFSSYDSIQMQAQADRINRLVYWNLGWSNEFVPQFRFWGFGRFVFGNGTVSYYQ